MDEDRVVLTTEQAVAMLPDEDMIHTFRQDGRMIVGANWHRKALIKAIGENECELSGEHAKAMGHGMAFCDIYGLVFVKTRNENTNLN